LYKLKSRFKLSFENVFQAVLSTSRGREGFLIALENGLQYKTLALYGASLVGCGNVQIRSLLASVSISADATLRTAKIPHPSS
jgi:hypothetical protein